MKNPRGLAATLVGAVGAASLTAGAVMTARGLQGRAEVRDELLRQKITFPEKGLPDGFEEHAGQQVETGTQARVFADVIGGNVRRATKGRTYSEVSAELNAAGGEDEALAALRQTAFMGETLRASLMSAYQAWQLTSMSIGLGVVLMGTGAAFVTVGAALSSRP
ncbi:hypothetical protein FHS43_001367 [Streptosporangium becharense]|uniref:Aromatic ring-opening dioxygenase LigA n=1 Tax=Streptosporangium becharense TaxID=1816182 RepID=A0A7W9MFZ8_9ACTN|nr:hypothetical protein [Streptosporangium becharense]MBB2910121.1 hypothetical protein [Streptosporangium becharense]MBB5818924.1 hypothetical protein [Streptosporangium becharense]